MPSTLAVLRRWIALDRALRLGVHVPSFAKQHRVSERTVHRDLAAFRAFGLRVHYGRYRGRGQRDFHQYHPLAEPLFTSNLPNRSR